MVIAVVISAWLAVGSKSAQPVPQATLVVLPSAADLFSSNVNHTVFALDAATGVMAWNWEKSPGMAAANPMFFGGFLYFSF
jgi:hypothetical protein